MRAIWQTFKRPTTKVSEGEREACKCGINIEEKKKKKMKVMC